MLGVQRLGALVVEKVIGRGRALGASTALPSNLFGVLRQTTTARPSTATPLEDEILSEERCGTTIAIKNRPKKLNALTPRMVSIMRKLYEGWEKDTHVHLVTLKEKQQCLEKVLKNVNVKFIFGLLHPFALVERTAASSIITYSKMEVLKECLSVLFKGNGRGFCAGGDVAAVSLAVKAGKVRPSSAHSSGRSVCASRSDYSRTPFGEHFFKGIQYRAYSGTLSTPGGPSGPESPGFGDLISQSVVTDDMLDSLIALKDFGNIEGLPPLDQILEEDEERDKKAMRRELERKKQLEIESKRVKTVDEFGRAYGTGRRKASTARVWIKEGEGKISINGLPHDLYFPDIDQRLQLLEPFWETNQLGVFDVRATVKGGGISGQSGALRHGISKALQLYDPTLRPALKSAGMLTRDSRVVERKKPGKAKARKSFQWVKR